MCECPSSTKSLKTASSYRSCHRMRGHSTTRSGKEQRSQVSLSLDSFPTFQITKELIVDNYLHETESHLLSPWRCTRPIVPKTILLFIVFDSRLHTLFNIMTNDTAKLTPKQFLHNLSQTVLIVLLR